MICKTLDGESALSDSHRSDVPEALALDVNVTHRGPILVVLKQPGLMRRILRDLLLRLERTLGFGPCISLPIGRLTATVGAGLGVKALG
jgi:hypothetical protein